jgi:hypothetical protein
VPPGEPIFRSVGPRYPNDGSGKTFTVEGGDETGGGEPKPETCSVDITTFGGLEDVLSNALMHGFHQDESKVRSLLDDARSRGLTARELIDETVVEFGFDRERVDAQVQAFLHCNCDHGAQIEPRKDKEGPPSSGTIGASRGSVTLDVPRPTSRSCARCSS